MDSVNSTTFIKRPPHLPSTFIVTDIQEKFLYTKELLSGRLFLGCYQERRRVPVLRDYRDVVIINSEETELQNDLEKMKKKWSGVTDIKWVGITVPEEFGFPKAYCLWVKLTNLPFGHYWFQIKHVRLLEEEIVLQLKCIRKTQAPFPITLQDNKEEKSERRDTTPERPAITNLASGEFEVDLDPKKALKTIRHSCISAVNIVQPHLTWKNFVAFVKTVVAVVIVIIMGIINFVGNLGDYVLKLLREITFLVNAFTPIIIQLIDFFSKIVGGFYILLAGMFYKRNLPNVQLHRNQNVYSIPYAEVARVSSQNNTSDWRERNRILRQELLMGKIN